MADRSCVYCEDRGDCYRCSPFFQPEAVHRKCGAKWKDHEIHTQDFYPPWASCRVVAVGEPIVTDPAFQRPLNPAELEDTPPPTITDEELAQWKAAATWDNQEDSRIRRLIADLHAERQQVANLKASLNARNAEVQALKEKLGPLTYSRKLEDENQKLRDLVKEFLVHNNRGYGTWTSGMRDRASQICGVDSLYRGPD